MSGVMTPGCVIFALARADFLERVRRYSFFLTMLFALGLGYGAGTGRITISMQGYRGVYTSAWVGSLAALITTCFVTLVGFYVSWLLGPRYKASLVYLLPCGTTPFIRRYSTICP